MSSLIIDYLNGSDNLQLIQAISLWGSKDEKMRYLFVDKKITMFKFVKKLGCDSILRSKEKKISDHRRSFYFKRSYPFGNALKITFANFKGECNNDHRFLFRLS